jgi:hypothetical protein
MVAKLTVKQFVVCDDIRREMTGKEILIGVYGSNIAVPSFPAPLNLAFWMQFDSTEATPSPIIVEFQLMGENDAKFASLAVQLLIAKAGLGTLALPAIPVSLQIPGNLMLQMKQQGGEWETVGTVGVEKGGGAISFMPPLGDFPWEAKRPA